MPTLLHQDVLSRSVKSSLVAFHPRAGERMFFSWSDRTVRGPGITRTGVGPPVMRTVWDARNPWATTDDPELMRRWSYYVDEDGLRIDERLAAGLTPCGGAPLSEDLRRTLWERSLEARRVEAVHTLQFKKRHPEYVLVGQVGCGDTTMNQRHVAFADDGGTPTFLHLDDEPVLDREYPCVVWWRNNPDEPVSFAEGVRFSPQPSPDVWIDGVPRLDDVDFAVSGKPIVNSNGDAVPLNQVTHFFSDLRHLFSMPKLTPPASIGGSVILFGDEATSDVWLGEKQLLDDVNLQRAAYKGPVLLDRLYGGLSVTRDYLKNVLLGSGYTEARGSVEWRPGQFRIDPHGSGFEIYFKPAQYPWNILAIGRYVDGARRGEPVVLSLVVGGTSGRGHYTLEAAVKRLSDLAQNCSIGLQGALLLDEGGDVFQKIDYSGLGDPRATRLDPLEDPAELACRRRLVRCCFFFATKRDANR